MIWNSVYVELATHISNIVSDPPLALEYASEAVSTIINVDTSESDGYLVSTKMLRILRTLYLEVYRTWDHNQHVRIAVEKINDFTIQYYGDLTTFVNGLDWPNGCVPYIWATYTDDLGHDTTGWSVCS
jgi:hypothetical protein